MLNLFGESWQELWSSHGRESAELGVVYTKPEIVSLILDLAGYTTGGQRLAELRVLEPSCGDGAFLRELVSRLVASEREQGGVEWNAPRLDNAVRAVDLDPRAVRSARDGVVAQLMAAGCPGARAAELAGRWVLNADFLLSDWAERFDVVTGNPPYVRIEDIPKPILQTYRETFATLTDRADLYVAFIEKGLSLLSPAGALAFICANRFAKNQYGRALRTLISDRYHVRFYLNLEHTQPFLTDVSAYPAILVVDRARGATSRAATLEDLTPSTLQTVRREAGRDATAGHLLASFHDWYPAGAPWIATSSAQFSAWEAITSQHPTLEESAPGTRVGIGVATGADKVFVLPHKRDDIEDDRQIPLALARDVSNDEMGWSGHYLINPFASEEDTALVDLARYPGLGRYLRAAEERLRARHVAKSRPQSWFRTIDRIWPSLQRRPKLLIPDIQKDTVIGFDPGRYYPHHNLYWVTSESWNLRALKTILRSTTVLEQVRAYSVQMRGGSIRFQAQTLRKVRVPELRNLPAAMIQHLASLAESPDQPRIDRIVTEAYRIAAVVHPHRTVA